MPNGALTSNHQLVLVSSLDLVHETKLVSLAKTLNEASTAQIPTKIDRDQCTRSSKHAPSNH